MKYNFDLESLKEIVTDNWEGYLKVIYGFIAKFSDDEDFPKVEFDKVKKEFKNYKKYIRKIPELVDLQEDDKKAEMLLYFLLYFSAPAFYNIGKTIGLIFINFDDLNSKGFRKKLIDFYSAIKEYTEEILKMLS